ncbi:MAG: hypothetical protein ACRC1D_10200 [Culicoidibacterales bacterium]
MNKLNKRLLITAAVALVTGFAIFIPSVITTIPYIQQVVTKTGLQKSTEVIKNVTETVNQVVIDASDIRVRIETSETEKFEVIAENSNIQILEVATTLANQNIKITATSTFDFPNISQNAQQFIDEIVGAIFHEKAAALVIKVPKSQPINLEIINAANIMISDSNLLGIETKITHNGILEVENVVTPTNTKVLTYINNNYGGVNLDYKTLNAFTDIVASADSVSIQNEYKSATLTANTLAIDANSIIYQYIPFTGSVNLHAQYGSELRFQTIPNIEWKIQANKFQIMSNSEGETLIENTPLQFKGHFLSKTEKQSGTLSVTADYVTLYTKQPIETIIDFVNIQPNLQHFIRVNR